MQRQHLHPGLGDAVVKSTEIFSRKPERWNQMGHLQFGYVAHGPAFFQQRQNDVIVLPRC